LIILQRLRNKDNQTTETLRDNNKVTTKKDVDLNLEENMIVILKPKPAESLMKREVVEVNLTLEMLLSLSLNNQLPIKSKNPKKLTLLFLNQLLLMPLLLVPQLMRRRYKLLTQKMKDMER